MKTTAGDARGASDKKEEGGSLVPEPRCWAPLPTPTTEGVPAGNWCQEAAAALEVWPTDGARRNTPSSPFPPPYNLPSAPRTDYTQREASWHGTWETQGPPVAGRARQGGDVRPGQGPARQGQRCWASFYPHRNSHALRQESLFTCSSDMENEVQKGSKKIAHGLLQLRYLGIRTNLSCLRFKLSNSVFSPDRRAG